MKLNGIDKDKEVRFQTTYSQNMEFVARRYSDDVGSLKRGRSRLLEDNVADSCGSDYGPIQALCNLASSSQLEEPLLFIVSYKEKITGWCGVRGDQVLTVWTFSTPFADTPFFPLKAFQ